jgi:hypothetical protein
MMGTGVALPLNRVILNLCGEIVLFDDNSVG